MVAILDFESKTILSIFYLQVARILPTKFRANWSFGSEEEVQIDFQDSRHLGFPIGTILAIFFYLQVTMILPTKFQVSWPFGSGDEGQIDFQVCRHGGHLGLLFEKNLAIFDLQVAPIFLPSFESISLSVQEMKGKQIFKIATMVAILDF